MNKINKCLILVMIIMLFVPKKTYANETKYCYYATDDANFMYTLIMRDYESASENKVSGHPVFITGTIIKKNGEYDSTSSNPQNILSNFGGVSSLYNDKYELINNKHMSDGCPSYASIKTIDNKQRKYIVVSNSLSELGGTTKYSSNIAKSISVDKFTQLLGGVPKDVVLKGDFITCTELLSSKMKEYINTILSVMRWIAVALVIVLSTIDIFKAVVSSSEDNMKKAQGMAIKRLIAGIAIFLIPLFVRLCIGLAENVYEAKGYEVCEINIK